MIALGRTVGILLLLVTSCREASTQSNAPVQIGSREILTNPAPVFLKNRYYVPASPETSLLPQSPVPATNFLALLGGWENVPDIAPRNWHGRTRSQARS